MQIKRANLTQYHYFEIPKYDFQIIDKEENKKLKINWEIYVGTPSQTLEGELWVIIGEENEI